MANRLYSAAFADFRVLDRLPEAASTIDAAWRVHHDTPYKPKPLHYERIRTLAIHRTIWEPSDPIDAARRFMPGGDIDVTGGNIPYHIWIDPDGHAHQLLELGEKGSHARSHNSSSIAVCLMHPAHRQPITHEQGMTLSILCRLLCLWIDVPVVDSLRGHDELKGGSADKGKECPGQGVSMTELRRVTEEAIADWWGLDGKQRQDLLLGAGLVL